MKASLMQKTVLKGIVILIVTAVLFSFTRDKAITCEKTSGPAIKLGAYYFAGWAGKCSYDDGTPENAWAKGMPTHFTKKLATEFAGRSPVWGWRDDTHELMEQQIKLASDNGIGYFSFCWYWQNNKGSINTEAIESDSKHLAMNLFMKARNNKLMEYCLLIANHAGFEIVGTEAWKQAADYWIENYFSHPRYLKSQGKPVVMIFLPHGADKEGLAYLQEAARKAGFPGVMVAACGDVTESEGFQAQTLYNTKPKDGLSLKDIHPFKLLADWNISVWEKRVNNGMPYIPVATLGWDRRPWEAKNGEGLGKGVDVSVHFDRGTPAELEDYIKKLVEWVKKHPEQVTNDKLALLYAWNETGEGGWLVPCKDDPEGAYLKAIKSVVYGK